MKRVLFVFLVFASLSSYAQESEAKSQEIIREKVNLFFKALEKRDTALYRTLVIPGGQIWTVRERQDTLRTSTRTFERDMDGLASGTELLEERAYLIEIKIHNDIAVAWVPYQFTLAGKFSHCGIDVFTFLNTSQGWKVINLSYSVEPNGMDALKKKYGVN